MLDICEPVLPLKWGDVLPQIEDYYWVMAARNRLVAITQGDHLLGLCTFFVLAREADLPRFYCRPLWSTPLDVTDGLIIYLDKLQATVWSHRLARAVERAITERVPSWQRAIWYRPTGEEDRRVEYRRRR